MDSNHFGQVIFGLVQLRVGPNWVLVLVPKIIFGFGLPLKELEEFFVSGPSRVTKAL